MSLGVKRLRNTKKTIWDNRGVASWPLVPKFAGLNPAEAVGFLRAKKILSMPSFGGEVKPSVPCRRFAACKRFGKITGQYNRQQFHLPPLGSLASWRTWGHVVVKVGTSKRGGKQWQTTPKNLPRMQRTRAIPVAWLSSGLCPDRPKGWVPIKIIINETTESMWLSYVVRNKLGHFSGS
jgi:hypothetical protein